MSSSGDEVLAQKTHGDDRIVVTQTLHVFAHGGFIIILEAGVTGTVLEAGAGSIACHHHRHRHSSSSSSSLVACGGGFQEAYLVEI